MHFDILINIKPFNKRKRQLSLELADNGHSSPYKHTHLYLSKNGSYKQFKKMQVQQYLTG